MKTTLISILAAVLMPLSLFSQNATAIHGHVINSDNKPMEYVNVMLLNANDSSLVKGTITDQSGKFLIEHFKDGTYMVCLSQLGSQKVYTESFETASKPELHLGTITLKDDVKLLEQVEVVARKPFIERHTDKMVVNVENSIVDAGGTAMEVLQRSPGITVGNDDNISLKGKSGVVIMIDGKPSRLSTSDLGEFLKSLSSDQVEKIEIMTNPPARFEASGNAGVINIILRKDKRMGANGSVRGTFGQGKRPDASAGVNLNFRQGKANVYGSYNYDWRKSVEDVSSTRNFRTDGVLTSVFRQQSDIEFVGKTHQYKAGIDYYANTKNTFGVMLNLMDNHNSSDGANTTLISDGSGSVTSKAVTVNDANIKWNDFNSNVNWLHKFDSTGKLFSFDIDYAKFTRQGNQEFTSSATDFNSGEVFDDILKNDAPSYVEIYSTKLDIEFPFNDKTKLEAGLKSSWVVSDNDVRYYNVIDGIELPDSSRTNRFKYSENINAAYFSLKTEINGFGIQAGLRAEHTNAKGEQITIDSTFSRDYIKLFPTFYVQRKLNDKHEMNFAFSRRYDRPSYQDLNPFRYFLDQYTYFQGNSLLQPQYSYNFELTHTYNSLYSVTVGYSYTDQVISQVTKQIDSIFTTYSTLENLRSLESYSISFSIPLTVSKWWNSNNFINGYQNKYSGAFEGGQVDRESFSFMIHSSNNFILPRKYSIELRGWYRSAHDEGILRIDDMSGVSVGLEKKLFNDQTSIKILVNDIFYTSRFSGSTKYMNQDFKISSQDDTRFVRLFISHRFGKKTVQQARRRTTAAEEERNRINKN